MEPPITLTGQWVGEYVQHDRPYPITADLVQDGERLTGSMCDGHPDRDTSVYEMASQAGLPPGEDEQIVARLRELVPDAAGGPVRYVSHLPAESLLDGRVDGPTVSFRKTYQGLSFGGFRVGDKFVGHERASHAVQYQGQLSPDRAEIHGRWWIDADPDHGTGRSDGFFTLRRQAGAGPAAAEDTAEAQGERSWWQFWK
jgi:hypothetical protein